MDHLDDQLQAEEQSQEEDGDSISLGRRTGSVKWKMMLRPDVVLEPSYRSRPRCLRTLSHLPGQVAKPKTKYKNLGG